VKLWAILDLLARSANQHNLSLHIAIKIPVWGDYSGFRWSTQSPDEAAFQEDFAWFIGKVIQRVKPLQERGIAVIDQTGESFQEHFRAVLKS
jgi:hypothetical protein